MELDRAMHKEFNIKLKNHSLFHDLKADNTQRILLVVYNVAENMISY